MAKGKVTPEELEKFEQFLFEMDDVLESFIEDAGNFAARLDESLDSLDALEEYWLSRKDAEADAGLLASRCARYLGEVFRKNIGGNWELCTIRPDHLYYKLPVLRGHSAPDIVFCPSESFGMFRKKETRGLLRNVVALHGTWANKPD